MSWYGTVTEYLGIGIKEVNTDEGKLGYRLTHEGLIKKIFLTTVITDCSRNITPNSGEALLRNNPDGDPARYQTK